MADQKKKTEKPETDTETPEASRPPENQANPQDDIGTSPESEAPEADAEASLIGKAADPGTESTELSGASDAGDEVSDTSEETAEDTNPLPVPQPEPVVIRKGGFIPLFLGGLAAAAIGFAAARFVLPEGWPWPGAADNAFETEIGARLDAQSQALADLKAEAGKAPDLSPLETRISGVQAAVDTLAGRLGEVSDRIAALDTRLTDLEKRPITDGASPAAVAAYERELKALQEAMAAQRAEIEKIAAEAAQKEASAEMTAQEAMQRAALSRIQTALDSGAGFADAAANLQDAGITLPPALSAVAADGVATRNDLAQSFPEAARAALTVARKGESGGGFSAFLKTQLGARSLEPRDGDDPDAVLSRAEAAVTDGRLTDAMAELETLPAEARAEMSGWLTRAATRLDALKAADALASEMN